MLVNGAQSVVPGIATAMFNVFSRGEVKLIMRYNGSIRFDFKEIYGCAHGLSAIIHIGARFKDSDLLVSDSACSVLAGELFFKRREIVIGRNTVNQHKTDVMPIARIFK